MPKMKHGARSCIWSRRTASYLKDPQKKWNLHRVVELKLRMILMQRVDYLGRIKKVQYLESSECL